MDLALKNGVPVIGLKRFRGARIQEGVVSLEWICRGILAQQLWPPGVIPQLSAVMGPCAGGAVLLTGHYRFHIHGAGYQFHVCHRSERGKNCDP